MNHKRVIHKYDCYIDESYSSNLTSYIYTDIKTMRPVGRINFDRILNKLESIVISNDKSLNLNNLAFEMYLDAIELLKVEYSINRYKDPQKGIDDYFKMLNSKDVPFADSDDIFIKISLENIYGDDSTTIIVWLNK